MSMITITANGDITAGGAITITADDELNVLGDLKSTSLSLTADGNIVTGAIAATGAININSAADITVNQAIEGAKRKLAKAECQAVLNEFTDASGHSLAAILLEREKTARWDGITNNLARKHLRQVRRGDRILFYHTGSEKMVVGEMCAMSNPMPDENPEESWGVALTSWFAPARPASPPHRAMTTT